MKEMAIVKEKQMEILDLKSKLFKIRNSLDSYNRRLIRAGKKKEICEVVDRLTGK